MKARDTANPPNRFRREVVAYDEGDGPPPSQVTLLDDHARSILSENDSPDLSFRFSANPYRGCQTACAYCMDGDTRILLADGATRALHEISVGDAIYGTMFGGQYIRTRVRDVWATWKLAYRVRLDGGTELIASGDHRFLTDRGWTYVAALADPAQRPFLTTNHTLLGTGGFARGETELPAARGGALAGQPVVALRELRVASIEAIGEQQLFDLTTDTGDFIANGVVSHNCYARPTHEYLDLGAGTDFDTKIVVKRDAPALLRAAFDAPSWRGDMVMFSGVTDCYQPVERELELTRRCLEVCLEYRNPVAVISKHALVERDVELFRALAEEARFHINISLAWTDAELARAIEPWAPSPERRLKIIEAMAKAGLDVGVMAAPIIPGLNDSQLVGLLERAAGAGATSAGWALLRLPGAVKDVFAERVRGALPLAADKILHRIRETRGGEKLYDARFHIRGRGEGPYAQMLATMFDTTTARLGMNQRWRILNGDEPIEDEPTTFRRPPKAGQQLTLF